MSRTTDPHPELSQDGRSIRRAYLGLALGGITFVLCLVLPTPEGMSDAAWRTAAVALLMAIWWITEAVPVAVTALLPLALFAPVGAGSIGEASAPYANPIIYLFLGGFLLALAIERWGLHRRIALGILSVVGSRGDRIVAGFLFGAAALSMVVCACTVVTWLRTRDPQVRSRASRSRRPRWRCRRSKTS